MARSSSFFSDHKNDTCHVGHPALGSSPPPHREQKASNKREVKRKEEAVEKAENSR